MSKIRIFQLAKEVGVPSKVLVERCQDDGLPIKNHMSSVDDETAERFRQEFGGKAAAPEAPKPEPAKRAPARPAPETDAPVRRPHVKVTPAEPARTRPPEPKAKAPKARRADDRRPPRHRAGPAAEAKKESRPEAKAGKEKPKEEEKPKATTHRHHREVEVPDSDAPDGRFAPQRQRRQGRPYRGYRGQRRRTRLNQPPTGPVKGQTYTLEPPITVRTISTALGLTQNDLIKSLMAQGIFATLNEVLSEEVLLTIAAEHEIEVEVKRPVDIEEQVISAGEQEDREEDLVPRAPVVTFLGHVDHGKTSLLDKIRDTDVASGESGGITQHIGAYSITQGDSRVVFLDTPGHEAFTAMRARGANVTDLVVLVVASDDGVMPQTEEAIAHARAAGVPIVIALNKIDRPNATPEQIMSQLSGLGLQPEEWGGDTILVRTSALTGEGVPDLLEMLILQSEVLELKGNPNRPAVGTVLEAERNEGLGVEATLLVQDGTLSRGDIIVAGGASAKIRTLHDDKGAVLRSVGPATPVKVTGFSDVPEVSSRFYSVKDLQTARQIAEERTQKSREASQFRREHVTLENLKAHLSAEVTKELRFIVKADVQGSMEVLTKAINDLAVEEVTTRILHSAVGGITESDILLADASDALVIGFNVVPDERARSLAEEHGVGVQLYQVIYHFIEEVKSALEGMLDPEEREKLLGHAEVRQIFTISRIGTIAGCFLKDGIIRRNSQVRLTRDGVIVFTGRLSSLKRVKDDVREVRDGLECGMKLDGYDDLKVGDIIEAFEIEKIARQLSSV